MEEKIKLGYLDEDYTNRGLFYNNFKDYFEVFMFDMFDDIRTLEELMEKIEESRIDVLAVDYKMAESGVVTYNGNEVVDMLYERKRYFPVFMITSHITRAMNNMNDVFLINDKDCIYKPEMLPGIVQKIKGAVASYRRRIAEIDERCRCLESKQNSDEGLTPSEEKELLSLHVEQNAIDPKGNPLSPDKLQTQSLKELQELVKNSRELLESLS